MPTRIERGTALPLDLLVDEAVFDLEMRQLWERDWVFATSVDAVADPGDHVEVKVGRESVIVVRGEDLAIRAFANACTHRGTPLIDGPGSLKRFSCPYHAWTFDTWGALLSVPYTQPDEICKDQHGLHEYRAEQWQGLVFVCLDDEVEPLAERLSVIDPYVRPLALDRLHHDTASESSELWKTNWKSAHIAAVDSYSHFRVHAETIEPVSPTDATYYLAGSAAATVMGGESSQRADHLVIAIPPSFVAVAWPDTLLWRSWNPADVGHTNVRVGMASEQPVAEGSSVHLPGWDAAFIDEDRAICERVQRNARARFTPGPLIDLESAVGDFHDYLAWRLADTPPPPPVITAAPGDRPEPL